MKTFLLLWLMGLLAGNAQTLLVLHQPKGIILGWTNRPGLYIIQQRPYLQPAAAHPSALDWTELDRVRLTKSTAPMFYYRVDATMETRCFYRLKYAP